VYFANNNAFSPEIISTLRHPYKMSLVKQFLFNIIIKTGLANFYWNSNLKKNGAFQHRFDKPLTVEIACK
jgi:hypothetical protein